MEVIAFYITVRRKAIFLLEILIWLPVKRSGNTLRLINVHGSYSTLGTVSA